MVHTIALGRSDHPDLHAAGLVASDLPHMNNQLIHERVASCELRPSLLRRSATSSTGTSLLEIAASNDSENMLCDTNDLIFYLHTINVQVYAGPASRGCPHLPSTTGHSCSRERVIGPSAAIVDGAAERENIAPVLEEGVKNCRTRSRLAAVLHAECVEGRVEIPVVHAGNGGQHVVDGLRI
mmetsp:Transcript_37086/g.85088  ORF Transcript_37086/g.85088 Transcript_37086/m.85088 type:complete len:182 (-) Transcript_37086:1371-1916(-)